MVQSRILFFLPVLALTAFTGPEGNLTGNAKIELTQQENMLQVKSYYLNDGTGTEQLSYRLFTVKAGNNGRSRNAQGGRFEVKPGEKELLAQTRLNINPGDSYAIKLMVYRNGEVVSQDSVQFKGSEIPEKTY